MMQLKKQQFLCLQRWDKHEQKNCIYAILNIDSISIILVDALNRNKSHIIMRDGRSIEVNLNIDQLKKLLEGKAGSIIHSINT